MNEREKTLGYMFAVLVAFAMIGILIVSFYNHIPEEIKEKQSPMMQSIIGN